MRRYWKIISICLVTILVIGTFYIQSSFATSNSLNIGVEHVTGNEDELQNIVLYGNFSPNHHYLNQSFQMTNEETIDLTKLSFFQRVSGTGAPDPLEELIEKHKNFMRSKDLTPNQFFEDENAVVYAQIKDPYDLPVKDLTFEIEVLTKKSEDITAFQVDVPQKENYGWMRIVDVQVIDHELKVIVRGERAILRVYTFDMNKQQLVSDDTIASIPKVESSGSDLSIINDTYYSIQRQKYLLIKIEVFDKDRRYIDDIPNLIVNEFIVYDIENNQTKKIVKPNEIVESMDHSSAVHHSTVLIPSRTANGVEVSQYDIESDKWGETLSFDLSETKAVEGESFTKLMSGKLYTIHATTSGHTIVIGDLETGESLYEGKLKVTYQGAEQKNYRLYFHEIESVQ
ncbi:hypothetical protein [Sporosarcina sp. YIM B06819]|uniref:hypothetical protein n=1 Tax=Sporosarcina sp. YIM B06819 TaxID=3081769 RepID=UPI00298C9985|nr:hypothetical protein [Sporosarcina sp. YIM B06819]